MFIIISQDGNVNRIKNNTPVPDVMLKRYTRGKVYLLFKCKVFSEYGRRNTSNKEWVYS